MASEEHPDYYQENETETIEKLFKVLVIGDAGCGKTSIIRRFVDDIFSEEYQVTIGADFKKKMIQWDDRTNIRLQLWDIAGQDRFACLTRSYFRSAVGAIIVCDVTREPTHDSVKEWKHAIDEKGSMEDGSPIPVVLMANKVDRLSNGAETFESGAKLEKVCQESDINAWYTTSAKDGRNVEKAIHDLITIILSNEAQSKPSTTRHSDVIKVETAPQTRKIKRTENCCT